MKFTVPLAATVVSGVVFAGPNPDTWFSSGYAGQADNVSINIVAAPGAGKRLRLYAAFITGVLNAGGTGVCFTALALDAGGAAILNSLVNNAGINVPVPVIIPPAGLILPENRGIRFVLQGDGTNNFTGAVNLYYSTEVIPTP